MARSLCDRTGAAERCDLRNGSPDRREELAAAILLECDRQRLKAQDLAASGRAMLGVDSETTSESEDSAGAGLATRKKKRRSNAQGAELQTPQKIDYHSVKFFACRGPEQVFVQARADVAKAIVNACLTRAEASFVETTDACMDRGQKHGGDPKQGCQPEGGEAKTKEPKDGKRITYLTRSNSYQVTWEDGDGKLHRFQKGLSVPSIDGKNRPLSADVFKAEMNKTFRQAMQVWNEMDRSGKPRFVLH